MIANTITGNNSKPDIYINKKKNYLNKIIFQTHFDNNTKLKIL